MRTTLILLVSLSACVGAETTRPTVNPLVARRADRAFMAVAQYPAAERENGLVSGTLSPQAALWSANRSELCFHLKLRGLGHATELADVGQFGMSVRDQDDRTVESARVRPLGRSSFAVDGREGVLVNDGLSKECVSRDQRTGDCNRWEMRPMYAREYREATHTIIENAYEVCFDNSGVLTPTTQALALLVNPRDPAFRTFAFRWTFATQQANAQ